MSTAVGNSVHDHRLIRRLGSGRSGEVWSADFKGRPCALKLLTVPRDSASLRRELEVQSALSRLPASDARWFPRIERVDLASDPPYVRMELVEGASLDASVPAGFDARLALAERILRALDAVHRAGYVHGDLAPRNVLVGENGVVKLIDVGYGGGGEGADIAVSAAPSDSAGVASPLYAAPERFSPSGPGPEADVFSFGKLFYRLLSGEQPHAVKPLARKNRALAPWDAFLFRCLEERPADRFASAGDALREFLRVFKPPLAAGEVRADCPECGASAALRAPSSGERFDCRGCGRRLEVLLSDPASRTASTALVAPGEPPRDVVFLEDAPPPPAPANASAPAPRPPAPSFLMAALVTLLGYFALWVPGAILNLHFLIRARRARREAGREPEGLAALWALFWAFFVVPVVAAAVALLAIFSFTSLVFLGK